MDRYEGVDGDYYYRDYVAVEKDGKPALALIYVMSEAGRKRKGADTPPGDEYYREIARGYRDAGFDEAPLESARGRALAVGGARERRI